MLYFRAPQKCHSSSHYTRAAFFRLSLLRNLILGTSSSKEVENWVNVNNTSLTLNGLRNSVVPIFFVINELEDCFSEFSRRRKIYSILRLQVPILFHLQNFENCDFCYSFYLRYIAALMNSHVVSHYSGYNIIFISYFLRIMK